MKRRIAIVATISNEWYESNEVQLAKAIKKGYKVTHNLNGKYCLLVNKMLKEAGKEISEAREQGNIDKVIRLLANAKNQKRYYRENLERADIHIYIDK